MLLEAQGWPFPSEGKLRVEKIELSKEAMEVLAESPEQGGPRKEGPCRA